MILATFLLLCKLAAIVTAALVLGGIVHRQRRESDAPKRTSARLREVCGIAPVAAKDHARIIDNGN